jgi:zinc transport system ATP-binding protein
MQLGNDCLALSIENLAFTIDGTVILQDVSFTVEQGEFIGIFGPNGGGKTTLLRILIGFAKLTQGAIKIFGRTPDRARSYFGYVPQLTNFDRKFPISVFEVVAMGLLRKLTWYGALPKEHRIKVYTVLERVGLLPYAKRSFPLLSGGEAQRVLLARALVSEPKLLFLDEPTASVDSAAEKEIREILLTLKGDTTILMVSHDLQTLATDVDRLLYVHRSVIAVAREEVCGHFALGLYHHPMQGGLPLVF